MADQPIIFQAVRIIIWRVQSRSIVCQ